MRERTRQKKIGWRTIYEFLEWRDVRGFHFKIVEKIIKGKNIKYY